MFCRNCGNQLENGALFCPKCGARSSAQSNTFQQEPSGSQQPVCPKCGRQVKPTAAFCKTCGARLSSLEYTACDADFSAPRKKKSKVPFIIAGAGAAFVLIGSICAVNASSLNHFFRKTFSSPESYFQYTELHALEKNSKTLSDSYQHYLDCLDGSEDGQTVELSFHLEDTGRSLLGTVIPVDLSWFQEVSLKSSFQSYSNTWGNKTEFYLNDSKLASFTTAIDQDLNELYMKIPELSKDYIGSVLSEGASYNILTDQFFFLQEAEANFSDYAPDGDTLENLINRYGKLIIENITDVKQSQDTLTAGSVSQKCTLLEARITETDAVKISDAVLSQLMEDDDVENMIRSFARSAQAAPNNQSIPDEDTAYQEFLQGIQEAKDSLYRESSTPSDSYLLSKTWVSNKGEIVGRSLSMSGDTSMEFIKYLMPENGKDYALTASCNTYNASITITGDGKQTRTKRDGHFSLAVNSVPMFTMDMEDYDRRKARKGFLNGRFTFHPQAGMTQETDGLGGILANYALQIDCESSKDSSCTDFSFLSAESLLFTLSVAAKQEDFEKPDFPSVSDTVYNIESEQDVAAYISGADWEGFFTGFEKSILPSEYLTQIKEAIQTLKTQAAYYSND